MDVTTTPPSRFRTSRVLRVVRRIHMFMGLVMFPWLLFYGVSGILFNHPTVGEDVVGQRVTGFTPWDPQELARDVVEMLSAGGGEYRLDPEVESRLSGAGLFKAKTPDGLTMLILDAEHGAGIMTTRRAREPLTPAPFAGRHLALPRYALKDLEPALPALLQAQGITPPPAAFHAVTRIAPTLQLGLIDRDGARWNATFKTGEGTIDGRRTDERPRLGVSQLFSMLHRTHHFPIGVQPRWFWALFQDLLGLVMVLWTLSGLVMWWQMRATRLAGVLSLVAALAISGAVMVGTAGDLTFGRVTETLGPGE